MFKEILQKYILLLVCINFCWY